jgi:hypothetical protein
MAMPIPVSVSSSRLIWFSRSVIFLLFCMITVLSCTNSYSSSYESNMKEMCRRTRQVNAAGMGGEGYFYWFFNKHKLAPPSAVPAFWAEVRAHCPGAW